MNNLNFKFSLDRKKPLGDQIYLNLREKIITIELYPLTEISKEILEKQISVIRNPVREA